MVNQRDSDVNLRVASETAQIARDAREDGQSLRIIQILSMLFLPASLISVIHALPANLIAMLMGCDHIGHLWNGVFQER